MAAVRTCGQRQQRHRSQPRVFRPHHPIIGAKWSTLMAHRSAVMRPSVWSGSLGRRSSPQGA
jgi:hypothetical protein